MDLEGVAYLTQDNYGVVATTGNSNSHFLRKFAASKYYEQLLTYNTRFRIVSISKGDVASMALLLTRGQIDINFNTGVTGTWCAGVTFYACIAAFVDFFHLGNSFLTWAAHYGQYGKFLLIYIIVYFLSVE